MSVMPAEPVRIAAVDDDPAAVSLLRLLMPEAVALATYGTGQECLDGIRSRIPDIAVLDLGLPDIDGLDLLRKMRGACPGIEAILLTADCSTASAVAAIKAGAADYLTKPVEAARFAEVLARSVQAVRLHREFQPAEDEAAGQSGFQGMVGRSPAMRKVFEMVRRIAPHFRTALVTGPSGTGKELVARALHASSGPKPGPLVVCNCAAIPESLAEAELFGRARGAYTGAAGESAGYFGRAAGGTLVLDEFGDLPLAAQAVLLRAVQFGEVQRLGTSSPIHVEVRIVASTNQDIRAAVARGAFREDLFFRLGAFEIALPPLGRRREDIPLLARHFVDRFKKELGKEAAGFTARAEQILLEYSWPGNVRELEQAVHYGLVMAASPWIDAQDLPAHLAVTRSAAFSNPLAGELSRSAAESRHVLDVLDRCGGDKRRAAQLLGVSRATLYRLLNRARPLTVR